MVTIRKISSTELSKLNIVNGFSRLTATEDDDGKSRLRQELDRFLSDRKEVWCAVDNNRIVGFGVVDNLEELPDSKIIALVEVAYPYRRCGIGTLIMSEILSEHGEGIIALNPAPEQGYEEDLDEFYRRHGFRTISKDLMVCIPSDVEKLKRWVSYLDELLNSYWMLRNKIKAELDKKRRNRSEESNIA